MEELDEEKMMQTTPSIDDFSTKSHQLFIAGRVQSKFNHAMITRKYLWKKEISSNKNRIRCGFSIF